MISTLPSQRETMSIPTLVIGGNSAANVLEAVQLLEGSEYLFEIDAPSPVQIDKTELFIPDDTTGRRGRVRTRLYTGRVDVRVLIDGVWTRPFAFEVRSAKLSYLDDYRWMLEDIAEIGSALLLERFAPSTQRLKINVNVDAETTYQRFVFLKGLLDGERLGAALRRIVAEPYVQWERIDEVGSPSRGMRSSGQLVRELLRPGARIEWNEAPHDALGTLPRRLSATRTEETRDNVPNRFVLFALEEWRGLVSSMLDVLRGDEKRAEGSPSGAVVRGLREGTVLFDQLSEWIQSKLFADVGPLNEFPIANQVLHKKEGYREVMQAYLLIQLGASLSWEGGEDVFGGGQRNVATLYEYWVFLELAKIVSSLCAEPLDLRSLVSESANGLHLLLRRQKAHAVTGTVHRHGRDFKIELCFNRQFAPGPNGTWTRSLRPDCSLHIVPTDAARRHDDVWLHFDAKYRVNRVDELIGSDESDAVLITKTEDLYKMHTYRDAIVRAAGAYVVFPGTEALTREQYDEVLPGLGAFPLKPAAAGSPQGSSAICQFLQRAFDHIGTQTTRHERARYWCRASATGPKVEQGRTAAPFLHRPPADTVVLLGYVKSEQHHQWIIDSGLYNLRADPKRQGAVGLRGSELSAELLVIYGEVGDGPCLFRVVGEPQILTAAELGELGYPQARGQIYFCLGAEPIVSAPAWLTANESETIAEVLRDGRVLGAPIVTDWLTLSKHAAR
ncbi:MAG TPA: DUF2357 domain-containing protein [Kofleriaceae bacterium]